MPRPCKGYDGFRNGAAKAGNILFSLANRDKEKALPIAQSLMQRGYHILATNDTWEYFNSQGLTVQRVEKANALELLQKKPNPWNYKYSYSR